VQFIRKEKCVLEGGAEVRQADIAGLFQGIGNRRQLLAGAVLGLVPRHAAIKTDGVRSRQGQIPMGKEFFGADGVLSGKLEQKDILAFGDKIVVRHLAAGRDYGPVVLQGSGYINLLWLQRVPELGGAFEDMGYRVLSSGEMKDKLYRQRTTDIRPAEALFARCYASGDMGDRRKGVVKGEYEQFRAAAFLFNAGPTQQTAQVAHQFRPAWGQFFALVGKKVEKGQRFFRRLHGENGPCCFIEKEGGPDDRREVWSAKGLLRPVSIVCRDNYIIG